MGIQTANRIRGRATGAAFFAGFGAMWLTVSLGLMHQLSVLTVSGILLGLTALLLATVDLFRAARRWPAAPKDPAIGRAFRQGDAVEWIVIAIVACSLGFTHRYFYIPSAVTAIVGLHKLFLARLYRFPLHYGTGAALIIWAAASVVFLPVDALPNWTGLGTGFLLWLSSAAVLSVSLRDARQAVVARAS
jgi:hypothetical protein